MSVSSSRRLAARTSVTERVRARVDAPRRRRATKPANDNGQPIDHTVERAAIVAVPLLVFALLAGAVLFGA